MDMSLTKTDSKCRCLCHEHITEIEVAKKGERKCSNGTAGQWGQKGEHAEKWNERESKLGKREKRVDKEADTGRFATGEENSIRKVGS